MTGDGLCFHLNGQKENILTIGFERLGQSITPLHFETDWVAEAALRASSFWPILARFAGTWGLFSSSRDSNETRDGLGLHWNRQRESIWTIGFELLGRGIPTPNFKIDRVGETALHASWFWPIYARFAATWRIVSSPRDSEITGDGLCFKFNNSEKIFQRSVSSF